ncbi:L,D-peptidoglycan transpeptidase YkuD (ErfK/YbiS/YcfS/YnhG family) [Streptomyces puniciscabiei]|uniref:L,D-peptidoglycan transpeptidase YkuD (ErfK/YbiS/YcfS/YnhG family) n=1 Tax=Streptomyces puniciscabiei TaxID=164348 RepID=A0A542UMJ2_9ACTN|nr:L,D-transpeptidase family protein [Streptomyces puniciscabiei]TQL00320.1 L,D-peptidoglycan transpeptidase YkuD (ErfK/YbiS/YcfS/YnhG family) [Streptomyces puniciscabiei]
MRPGVVLALVSASSLGLLGVAPGPGPVPLPAQMADTGGGGQLIIAQAPATGSTSGTVTWWDLKDGQWVQAGSAPARFGANGLVEGAARQQGTNTTPTGLYGLPFGFGIKAAPSGTRVEYRAVKESSWWCQDNDAAAYNRWVDPLPADCRASESEHLISYSTQYAYGLVIGFNYDQPVRGRGAGIFLHVNGQAATAGCVSVPEDAMQRILQWAEPGQKPHMAIGTVDGPTAVTRY